MVQATTRVGEPGSLGGPGQRNEDQGGKEKRLGRSPEGHRAWWAKARGWAEGAPRTGGERVEEYNKLCCTTVVLRLQ